MSTLQPARRDGQTEIDRLRARLAELEETLRTISGGEVEALEVSEGNANRVYTLQAAEHPYRVMVQAMNEGAATLTPDGTILFANPRLGQMLGTPEDQLVGTALRDIIKQIECEHFDDLLNMIHAQPTKAECVIHVEGGSTLPVYLSFSPLKGNGFDGICLIVTDLSGQKRREQELAAANESLRKEVGQRLRAEEALREEEESLRQLSARLLKLQDEERRRIARDLHESTGQKVAALCLDLTLAIRQASHLPPNARDTLQRCSTMAEEITTDIRTLSYLLHPPLLDEVGLRSAARWYVDGFTRRSNLQVELELPAKLPRMHQDVELALFRILQESLTNVHRHAKSKTVQVRISANDHSVTLEVQDDGQPTSEQAKRISGRDAAMLGVGIRGMRERVRQLGGKLDISSGPQGTVIKATLPLRQTRKSE